VNSFQLKTSCPKCGNSHASISFCDDLRCLVVQQRKCFVGEHIDRVCIRCGYRWMEACVDAETEVENPTAND